MHSGYWRPVAITCPATSDKSPNYDDPAVIGPETEVRIWNKITKEKAYIFHYPPVNRRVSVYHFTSVYVYFTAMRQRRRQLLSAKTTAGNLNNLKSLQCRSTRPIYVCKCNSIKISCARPMSLNVILYNESLRNKS